MSPWEIVGEVVGIIVLLGGAVGLIGTSFFACVFMSVTKETGDNRGAAGQTLEF